MGHFSITITFIFLFLTRYHRLVHADSLATNVPPYSCDTSNPLTKSFPFCNLNLTITQRAKDIVSRLTLDEKISQLVNTAPAIPRLGIPSYQWWNEALHGVSYVGKGIRLNGSITAATSFPQIILIAASFDPKLWYRISKVIGTEARGVYNAGQAQGMTFWAPNINIFRDPRWGRGQETAGEDPLVNSKYGVSYVRGLQGDSFEGGKLIGGRLKASACCKHFTAYDLENWKGVNRYVFDAKVTLQDLADTYQPSFHSCVVQGRSSGIMCAYNRVNGVPNCADYNLLTNTARKKWNFNGYIASDCDAVRFIYEKQGYAKTPEDVVADVLRAGMDVECGNYMTKHAKSAVLQKKIPISQIDRALHNLFTIRIRLGLFDGNPTKLQYGRIGPNQVCSKENLDLALEAARSGIVLLKNTASILPLPRVNTLGVIGPNANKSSIVLLGNYFGQPCKQVSILKGFYTYASQTHYRSGCTDGVKCASAEIDRAVEVAKISDYVILVMGLDQSQETETLDRDHLELPGKQQKLINSVAKASKKPVILVILCGGPVDITFAKNNDKIGGIIWAGYPGELGGRALAQVVFGDYNPGGRLPMTWYPKDFIKIPMTDMRMRADPSSGYPGRTYRFYTGPKVYEFGYGLSYSNYSYNFISVKNNNIHINQSTTHSILENSETIRYKLVSELGKKACKTMSISVTLGITNTGSMAGKHPVLLFVKPKKGRNGNPVKQLVGFESVTVEGGGKGEVGFEVSVCEHLSRANESGVKVIEEGGYLFLVGELEYSINITL
ncbi:putative glycosidase [Medicago truncatula]|uniref:Glycoside hydrolase family 3 amino-terminal domain protein n=1 Tax=Medicago truncatula TaxID=3880 RepID=G7KA59_MEDTR|nr:probable beta-D-xylosidase 7 isoform X1 [Medicago truncatula]AES97961.1 glycoside hydrolase family 3 amino-terminal domain protein [Medicago truncatula]RHN56077.1 putative glycosidase [Medicago truncatula]